MFVAASFIGKLEVPLGDKFPSTSCNQLLVSLIYPTAWWLSVLSGKYACR